jgi:ribosomal protein S12 methylthiotransferase
VARQGELMAIQQQIAFEWNQAQIGRKMRVILDAPVPKQRKAWVGRSTADAPDVDGLVYVTGDRCQAGQIVECEIVASQGYDLIGVC